MMFKGELDMSHEYVVEAIKEAESKGMTSTIPQAALEVANAAAKETKASIYTHPFYTPWLLRGTHPACWICIHVWTRLICLDMPEHTRIISTCSTITFRLIRLYKHRSPVEAGARLY